MGRETDNYNNGWIDGWVDVEMGGEADGHIYLRRGQPMDRHTDRQMMPKRVVGRSGGQREMANRWVHMRTDRWRPRWIDA